MAKNSGKREPFVEVAIGETSVGKTYQTLKKVFNYVPKIKRPALIVDFQDEYTKAGCGHDIPSIDMWPNPKKKWRGLIDYTTPTIRRIRPITKDGKKMSIKEKGEALGTILTSFKNGKIVIDDIDKYAVFNTDQEMVGSLMGNRQPGLDIIITHQSFGVMTTMECRNLQVVRMHHTSDSPMAIKDKLQENLEIMMIAYYIVKDQYELLHNHRFFMMLNARKKKMWGCTKKTFDIACQKYIFKHKLVKEEIEELIFRRVIDPKKKKHHESEETARKSLMEKLSRYYSDKPVIVNN